MESEGSSKDYFRKSMAELIAILPQEAGNTKNWEKLLEPLANATDFNVVDIRHNDIIDCPTLYIEYKKEVYPIDVDWYEYHFVEDTMVQQFSTENIATLQQATNGIKFSMLYTTDAQTSVHLLLKIICLLVPKQIGIFNCNSYSLLSPVWAKCAVATTTPPSPNCLYTIHAVYEDKNKWLPFSKSSYWLHTHGLNCCGIPELELIGEISKKNYDFYTNLLSHLVNYVISEGSLPPTKENLHFGWLDNHQPIMITWVSWEEGLKSYKKNILGGAEDRDEAHNQNTSIIFIYHSEKAYEKQKYSLITSIKESAMENPLLFFTDKETERLNAMAHEQLSYLIEGLQKEGSSALVKISLTVDEEFKEEGNSNLEHIWFKVEKVTEDSITGVLIQEPYYIKNMHEGSVGTYPTRLITDWKLYTDGQVVSPDDVYLLKLP